MNELETSRNEISRIDRELAKLFEQRMHACAAVAEKHRLTARETEVFELLAREAIQAMLHDPNDIQMFLYYIFFH